MPHLKSLDDLQIFLESRQSSDFSNTANIVEFLSFDIPSEQFNNATRSEVTEFIDFISREIQLKGKINILTTHFRGDTIFLEFRRQTSR